MSSPPRARKRNAEATKARLLSAAKREFSKHGLAGARVDEIARSAKANKRMLYHYFGSKESLFTRVLEEAYLDIRRAEQKLNLKDLEPLEALASLVRFTWNYYLKNPEFINLVNSENLHKARHISSLSSLSIAMRGLIDIVEDILQRGQQTGVIRHGIDATQLNITIAAIGFYYLTNRYTGSFLFERDLMDKSALEQRLLFNIETILRLVRN
ncbi:MAG: TetR family transcriptional regulator [Aestuariivita sp.]|nr:TetR family transcriptional regulator [Aestuariivita sp.]MCY4201997.1 TetR family transcriptional regulator [Aestuariivita sp.]MCY4288193.1 TetR family transcriptional regulator [Aestuariivita sp.]MCY4346242.1 TetR family transcriptional regulator [Aestuariivita sp.]